MINQDKNSNGKALKAGAGYVLGNYMLKGITFISVPIFSRLLMPKDFGLFSTYVSYESMLYILIGMALHSSINNAKYDYKEKIDEYVSSLVSMIFFSGVIWILLANLFWNGYSRFFGFSHATVNLLVLHCVASALLQLYNVYIGLTYSYKSFLKISYLNAIGNILLSVLLILFVTKENKFQGRIWGTAIPVIAIGIYIAVYFFRKAKPKLKKEYIRYSLSYSLPIVPHGIAQVILSSFDRIMIKNMVGEAEAGIYSFSYTINQIFMVLSTSIQNVWKPWMYEKMNAKQYDEIKKKSADYVLGIAFSAMLVLMISPEVIKILGAKEYWDSTACVVPVVIGGFFSFLYTLPSLVEYFYKKTMYIAMGSVAAASLNIVLNYFCIKKYGYIAAAYTTLVTYFLYFMFHFIIAKKLQGKSIFDSKRIGLVSLGLLLVGFFVIYFEHNWLIRWGCELLLGSISLLWAEKTFSIVEVVRSKLRR